MIPKFVVVYISITSNWQQHNAFFNKTEKSLFSPRPSLGELMSSKYSEVSWDTQYYTYTWTLR